MMRRHLNTHFLIAGNAGPPHDFSSWFQCKGQGKTQDDTADHIPHDIYVIGTQEDPLSERELAETVKSVLRNITNISFKQVGDCGALQIVMLYEDASWEVLASRWPFTRCGTFGSSSSPSPSTRTGSLTFFLTVWRRESPTLWVRVLSGCRSNSFYWI